MQRDDGLSQLHSPGVWKRRNQCGFATRSSGQSQSYKRKSDWEVRFIMCANLFEKKKKEKSGEN